MQTSGFMHDLGVFLTGLILGITTCIDVPELATIPPSEAQGAVEAGPPRHWRVEGPP